MEGEKRPRGTRRVAIFKKQTCIQLLFLGTIHSLLPRHPRTKQNDMHMDVHTQGGMNDGNFLYISEGV